jgi:hypothetical protein
MKEETLNNSNVDRNISFNHPRVDTKERWEKLKHIVREIEPHDFRLFIVIEKKSTLRV